MVLGEKKSSFWVKVVVILWVAQLVTVDNMYTTIVAFGPLCAYDGGDCGCDGSISQPIICNQWNEPTVETNEPFRWKICVFFWIFMTHSESYDFESSSINYLQGAPLSTNSFSTIPGIVQFQIVQNNTNSPI